ncbi:MAG: HAD-IIIA family hydrolase [Candidatus Wallbacteria bacterium]|nr:HAD-IIIA family hydrolase [Candidatus Wallbacteria bacterium]
MRDSLKIKALALDVDGVLTDGRLYYSAEGEEMKAFHVHDGLGMKRWKQAGYKLFIITGRNSMIVENRATELSVDETMQGVSDKKLAMELIAGRNSLRTEEIAFVGDDLNDLPAFGCSGFAMCPSSAVTEVRESVDLVLLHRGGEGAVREAVEFLLSARGEWTGR